LNRARQKQMSVMYPQESSLAQTHPAGVLMLWRSPQPRNDLGQIHASKNRLMASCFQASRQR
jgi:hypothetical protein